MRTTLQASRRGILQSRHLRMLNPSRSRPRASGALRLVETGSNLRAGNFLESASICSANDPIARFP